MRYQEFATLIFENRQQYRQMLQGMVDAEIITQQLANEVADTARKLLKRQDRVVWWLYWYRAFTVYDFFKIGAKQPDSDPAIDAEKDIKNKFEKITKHRWDGAATFSSDEIISWKLDFKLGGIVFNQLLGDLAKLPAIDKMQWSIDLGPTELIDEIERIETAWLKEKRHVKQHFGDKIIDGLVYNGGKHAWVMLDRGACGEEGDAMGHCGNKPSYKGGDLILSFRTIRGPYHKPHLTFILHGNGFLGEMKGRENEKPEPRYYPYIIDLLKKPFIKGIAGGGYAPEENFELSDLSENQMSALLEEKPSLGGPVYMYNKRNGRKYSPEIGEMLEPIIHDVLPYLLFDKESGTIIVETYKDIADIAEEFDDRLLKFVGDVFEGRAFLDTYVNPDMIDDRGVIEEIYDKLPNDVKNDLKQYIEKSSDVEDENRDNVLNALMDLIENDDDIRSAFAQGIYSGVEVGTEDEMYSAAMKHLESNGFSRIDEKTSEISPGIFKKQEWILKASAENVLDFMLYEDEEIENYKWNDILEISEMEEPRYGWDGWDAGAAAEITSDELYNVL